VRANAVSPHERTDVAAKEAKRMATWCGTELHIIGLVSLKYIFGDAIPLLSEERPLVQPLD